MSRSAKAGKNGPVFPWHRLLRGNTGPSSAADTRGLFEGRRIRRRINIERSTLQRLAQLDWSAALEDL